MKKSAQSLVERLLETDVDAPDMSVWGKRLSVEHQLDELFGRWMPYFKNDPEGKSAKQWAKWFQFGTYSVWITFSLLYQRFSGHLRYDIRHGDWQHHNSEYTTGQPQVLKVIEIFKEALAALESTPPKNVSDVVRQMERPLHYAYETNFIYHE